MTRFMVLGDIHGDVGDLDDACRKAKEIECEFILQVGDNACVWPEFPTLTIAEEFALLGGNNMTAGYGQPRTPRAKKPLPPDTRLKYFDDVLKRHSMPMFWLDGNHEWFAGLRKLGVDIHGVDVNRMTDWVTYIPRGHAWEWDNVTFLALGGAVSVDRDRRTPGLTWGPEEELTTDDCERAIANGPVDVMFAHDAFDQIPALDSYLQLNGFKLNRKMQSDCDRHRRLLGYVVQKVKPKVYYHGHYHYDYYDLVRGIHVRGLNQSGTGNRAWWLFDTEDFKRGIQR